MRVVGGGGATRRRRRRRRSTRRRFQGFLRVRRGTEPNRVWKIEPAKGERAE